jgi:hypothetical protein
MIITTMSTSHDLNTNQHNAQVVGKGAFGKVMLVRKKSPGPDKGTTYAMKVGYWLWVY